MFTLVRIFGHSIRLPEFLTAQIVGINNILLTVLGFVVGLALSFRSSTAYERYEISIVGRVAKSIDSIRTIDGRMVASTGLSSFRHLATFHEQFGSTPAKGKAKKEKTTS